LLIAGALVGALLRRLLPEHHLDTHAKDIVRLGCGLIATIAGLVLGLLINSAKTNYDTQRDEIRLMTANIIMIDQLLEQYGVESRPARQALRSAVPAVIDRLWGNGAVTSTGAPFAASASGEAAYRAVRALAPATEAQRFYQGQAMTLFNAVAQTRLILFEQSGGRMPLPFLVVLVFWLVVLFVSFSLFSPLNPTALAAIAVIALSASGAIFLILEMYSPFSGLMQIDSGPLRQALAPLVS
jgi:hypothetical protein